MSSEVRPVFILSLPRAGSTLLQRMLNVHPEIASTVEPWILLPFLSSLREGGYVSGVGHATMLKAVRTSAVIFRAAMTKPSVDPGSGDTVIFRLRKRRPLFLRQDAALRLRGRGDLVFVSMEQTR